LLLALALGSLAISGPGPVRADGPVVTNCNDSDDGSLRGQIAVAATSRVATTITFDPTLNCAITLTSGTLLIDRNLNLTIDGGDDTPVTVDGNNAVTVFTLYPGVTVTLKSLIIQHGNANQICVGGDNGSCGGGIYNNGGTLTVIECTITGNHAGFGGGIDNNEYDLRMPDETSFVFIPHRSNPWGACRAIPLASRTGRPPGLRGRPP
jgi:hypothetical protein